MLSSELLRVLQDAAKKRGFFNCVNKTFSSAKMFMSLQLNWNVGRPFYHSHISMNVKFTYAILGR